MKWEFRDLIIVADVVDILAMINRIEVNTGDIESFVNFSVLDYVSCATTLSAMRERTGRNDRYGLINRVTIEKSIFIGGRNVFLLN